MENVSRGVAEEYEEEEVMGEECAGGDRTTPCALNVNSALALEVVVVEEEVVAVVLVEGVVLDR